MGQKAKYSLRADVFRFLSDAKRLDCSSHS